MNKFYKCLKLHPLIKEWKVGDDYELDEANALDLVEKGYLQPIETDPQEDMVERIANRVLKNRAQLVADIRKEVLDGMDFPGQHRGPQHVRIVEDDRDKRKNLGDMISLVGMTGLSTEPSRQHAAREELFEVYAALENKDFDKTWRAAQSKADDVVIEKYIKSNGLRMSVADYRKTALAEGSGTTGGYTVPPEYANELLTVDPEDTVLVGRTDDYALTGRELRMPMLNITSATGTAGITPFFGQMQAYWTGEAATRSESEPAFKEVVLVANELSGYALASRNLLFDNKVALEQRLTRLFKEMVAWYRDYAYLVGDGVAKPRGILNAPATISQSRGTASQVNYVDVCKMLGQFLPTSWKSGLWVIQQSALQSMLQMADSNGQLVIQPYYSSTAGPAAVKPVMSILGLPVKVTEKTSILGTSGDLMLIDPKQYVTGTRKDIEIASSDQYKFVNNQIAYRYIFRGDGEPWMDGAITLQDGTSKISPFVKLT